MSSGQRRLEEAAVSTSYLFDSPKLPVLSDAFGGGVLFSLSTALLLVMLLLLSSSDEGEEEAEEHCGDKLGCSGLRCRWACFM